MRKMGGVRVANPYRIKFFPWWRRHCLIAIDDYPYVEIEFSSDLDMPLQPGVAYGDIGNKSRTPISFLNYLIFCVF